MLDELGARELKRVYRFFQNAKNFGSLSLMGKLRTIAIPVVPVALFGGGMITTQLQAGSIIKELNVTPKQQVLMQSCIDAHNSKYVEFGENVSTPKGCACTAKRVSSETPPAHYAAYSAVQNLAIDQYYWEYSANTEDGVKVEWENRISDELKTLTQTQNVNRKGLRHMFESILDAEQLCDKQQSYDGEALETLAASKPLQTPIWESDSDGMVEISLRGVAEPIRLSMN